MPLETKQQREAYRHAFEAFIDGELQVETWYKPWTDWDAAKDGMPYFDLPPNKYRRKPKKVSGWVNVYDDGPGDMLYPTKELAQEHQFRAVKQVFVTEP